MTWRGKISTVSLSWGCGGLERGKGSCLIHTSFFSIYMGICSTSCEFKKEIILRTEMLPKFTVVEWWAYSSRGSA